MKLLQWFRNKFGRLVSAAGFLLAGADLDISPVKDALDGLIGHAWVQAITVGLFLASWARHQYVASRHPKPDPLPPPVPEATR